MQIELEKERCVWQTVAAVLDICLLGTGGTLPLTNRWLTSLMVRYQGHAVLIDCGEGTQIAAQEAGMSLKPVDMVLLTHLHADHVSGMPGLLLTMGNMGRTEELRIVGPAGTERVVNALRVIAPNLPFNITTTEITKQDEYLDFLGCRIHAFKVLHGVICYGYSLSLERAGKFDPVAARERNIPLQLWRYLQKGETIEQDGVTYTPDMVMGPPRPGLKVTYCTDTRPVPAISAAAKDSDLFVCEGMYGDVDMQLKALENRHMLFAEAARLAVDAGGVKRLWLTHFSPSMPNPQHFKDYACRIFAETHIPKDGESITLAFED